MATGIVLLEDNAAKLADWCGGLLVVQHDALDHEKTALAVNVPTAEGVQRAQLGDVIVRENDGTYRIVRAQEGCKYE